MKKNTLSIFLALFSLNTFAAGSSTSTNCPTGWICPSVPFIKADTKVGAWYAIYFYNRGSHPVDHWSVTRYKPYLGYYSSGDVIQSQYAKMKEAGLNYLLLDHTNGLGNDAGAINDNAIKIFNNLPADIPIAIANGAPLWVSYDGQGNHISRERRLTSMEAEANSILSQFAQRPNYLKWYDSKTNSTKPLLVVYNDLQHDYPKDEIVRYWDDSRFAVRYAGGFIESSNPLLAPYASRGGLWGWATQYPQMPSSETMVVQPGWHTEHIPGRDRVYPVLHREDGMFYMKQWLEIIKHKPSNVIIASWNDWAEETSIEPATVANPAAEAFKDHYGEETPDWYLQITKGYSNLRTGLMPHTFYKMENDSRVFEVVDGKLVLQNEMPRRKPVILMPQGSLNSFIGGVTPPSTPAQIPSGLFMVGIGLYQSSGSTYCHFQSMSDFTSITGKDNADGITRYPSIPGSMGSSGACKNTATPPTTPSTQIPAGLFKVGIGLYQSSGASYCHFQSMPDFTAITGKTNAAGITSYPSIPSSMNNAGVCKRPATTPPTQIPSGLFMVGVGLYQSSGSTYCYFQSMSDYTSITGRTNADGVTRYPSIPSSMNDVGACKMAAPTPPSQIPAGLFMVGVGIFHSSGDSFCQFGSMSDFTAITGRTNANGISRHTSIPSSMRNVGPCKPSKAQ